MVRAPHQRPNDGWRFRLTEVFEPQAEHIIGNG